MPRCPQCHLINPSMALACDCGHQFTGPDTSTPTIDRQRRRERFNAWLVDKSIALASAVIALCALVATIQQGYAVRQHQRLSMIPWLGFSFDHNEKGAGLTMDQSGPDSALFRTFEVFVDGVPQPHWNAVAGALGLPGGTRYDFSVPYPRTLFAPGRQAKIFWIAPGPAAEALRQQANRLSIVACYCSLYKECWRVTNTGIHEEVSTCSPFSPFIFGASPLPEPISRAPNPSIQPSP